MTLIPDLPPIPTEIIAALIGFFGAIITALIIKSDHRVKVVEHKIDGIKNGMPSEVKAAIAQLLREKAERDIYGLPMRRIGDKAPVPGVVPSEIATHGPTEEPGHIHSGLEPADPEHTHTGTDTPGGP